MEMEKRPNSEPNIRGRTWPVIEEETEAAQSYGRGTQPLWPAFPPSLRSWEQTRKLETDALGQQSHNGVSPLQPWPDQGMEKPLEGYCFHSWDNSTGNRI